MRKWVLLNVGPCVVPEKVRNALLQPDIVHRETEFFEILTRTRENLMKIYKANDNYTTVIICGSGTAGLEATISSVVRNGKLLIVSNGYYGEMLMTSIARTHNIETELLKYEWGEGIKTSDVEDKLKSDQGIKYVTMVHTETSTGILNELDEIAELVSDYDKTFIVDSTASIGAEDLDVVRSKIDFCIGSPNKCIESVPGVSMVCCDKEKLEELKDVSPRTWYLNLYNYYRYEEGLGERTGTPFTPPVQVFYALDEAFNLLLQEGVEKRRERYANLAKLVRDGFEDMGFRLFLPRETLCCCITPIRTPKNLPYQLLHDQVKEDGFIIYAGMGTRADLFFRVGNMGQLTKNEITGFLNSVRSTLEERKLYPQY